MYLGVYLCVYMCVYLCVCLPISRVYIQLKVGMRKSEIGNRVSWCLHITIIRLVPLSDLFDMCPGPWFSLAWNCAYLDLAWTCSKPCIRRQSTIDKRDKREEATVSSLRATARVQLRQSGIGYTYIYIYIYLCVMTRGQWIREFSTSAFCLSYTHTTCVIIHVCVCVCA